MYNDIINKCVDSFLGVPMWPSIFGFLGYYNINKEFELSHSPKLAMNYTAFTHAFYASVMGLFGNMNLFRINSGGYFLFDIYYLLKNRKLDTLRIMYIYHHIASLYYMSLNPLRYNWLRILSLAEFCNLPNYIVYHYMKKREEFATLNNVNNATVDLTKYINIKPYDNRIRFWKKIQLVTYGVFRLGFSSYFLYKEITTDGKVDNERVKDLWPVIPIYFMGLLWSGAMFKDMYSWYLYNYYCRLKK